MAVLEIGGTAVKSPSAMYVELKNKCVIDTNALGDAVIDTRPRKRTITCIWAYMTAAELASVLLLAGGTDEIFHFKYHDPVDNASKTAHVYCVETRLGTTQYKSTVPVTTDIEIVFQEQ